MFLLQFLLLQLLPGWTEQEEGELPFNEVLEDGGLTQVQGFPIIFIHINNSITKEEGTFWFGTPFIPTDIKEKGFVQILIINFTFWSNLRQRYGGAGIAFQSTDQSNTTWLQCSGGKLCCTMLYVVSNTKVIKL